MIAPWYCKAYERLEREIKDSLEHITGNPSCVHTVEQELPPGFCGGPAHTIFEVYDENDHSLAAKISLGHIPKDAKKQPLFETKEGLNIQTYQASFTPTRRLRPLVQKVGDIGKKIEAYADEYTKLTQKLGELVEQTILLQQVDTVDCLKPYAKKLLEAGRPAVIGFYGEAQWNAKGMAEAFGVSEEEIKNVVEQIRAQLPQKYLKLEEKIDAF